MSNFVENEQTNQLELFGVSRTVTWGVPDPLTPPQIDVQFHPIDYDLAEAKAKEVEAAAIPPVIVIDAEPGQAISINERARILGKFVLPCIAGVAMREAMQTAMYTPAAADITNRYGVNTEKRVRSAAENAKDMQRTAWNILYTSLGYQAVAATGIDGSHNAKRWVSEDLQRLNNLYGRGKAAERNAFLKVLSIQRNRPKKLK